MTQSAILEELKNIIAHELDVNVAREDITLDAPLFEAGLGLDSVVLVELIALVEKKFNIKFADDELHPECFSNLRVLADTIVHKQ